MKHKTNPVARVFAILFAILFVITAFLSLLAFSNFNQVFDPEIYKQALVDAGVYKKLTDLIGEQIVYQLSRNTCLQDAATCTEEQLATTPLYLASVDASEWSAVFSQLIDQVWLQTQLESAIDQLFTFLNNPGKPFSLTISLVDFKARLGGEDGYQALVMLLNSLEPCTAGDLLNLSTSVLIPSDTSGFQLCRPDETVLKLGESAIRETLKTTADNLPDDTSALIGITSGGMGKYLVPAQRTMQIFRMAVLISPVIPLFLLLVITLLVVRSINDFLIWWGIPLTITGLLALLSAMLITPILRVSLLARIEVVRLAPGLMKTIQSVILQVADAFRNTMLIHAGVVCTLGIFMIILSLLLRAKVKPVPTG